MIINEKGLVKAMKDACKGDGFQIVQMAGKMLIYNYDWYVEADVDKVPRKALAYIVECCGTLPREGQAVSVVKGEEPNFVLGQMMKEDIEEWRNFAAAYESAITSIVAEGRVLYQKRPAVGEQHNPILAVRPGDLAIVERDVAAGTAALASEDHRLRWKVDGETVILQGYSATGGNAYAPEWLHGVWNVLEHIDIHTKAE